MNDWTDAEQHANRAVDLLESGRLAEAEAALRHALAIDADQPEWHHQLGMILEMGGRYV
jgi:Flp pilus assembly protein TadD